MQEPLVSIIIPVYNTENYIQRAVISIQKQNYGNIEIILIDDGSTDNSKEKCMLLANEDKRISYYHFENGGAAAARNRGISKANGKYIIFVDSDDEIKEETVGKAVSIMEKDNCDMLRYGFESRKENVIASAAIDNNTFDLYTSIVLYLSDRNYYLNLSSSVFGVYRKSIIDKGCIIFDERLARGEDSLFTIRYMLKCNKIVFLKEALYIYYPYFENRHNSTDRARVELINEYELCLLLFKTIWNEWNDKFSEEDKKSDYNMFIDRVIGFLVRYAAYSQFKNLSDSIHRMYEFVNDESVISAVKYYHRSRKTDSYAIPFLLKSRMPCLLWIALCSKKNSYFRKHIKKRYEMSIWKKDSTVDNRCIL